MEPKKWAVFFVVYRFIHRVRHKTGNRVQNINLDPKTGAMTERNSPLSEDKRKRLKEKFEERRKTLTRKLTRMVITEDVPSANSSPVKVRYDHSQTWPQLASHILMIYETKSLCTVIQ